MFNIGDVVEIVSDINSAYDFTKIGSYGEVISAEGYGRHLIRFHFINNSSWSGREWTFTIKVKDLALKGEDFTSVERKIRSIYARQYRRTGQSCFAYLNDS